MSNDFLSAEELAELEAELSDLDDSDEPKAEQGASEEALEDAPKETPENAEPPETEAVEEPASDEPSEAELEAELNPADDAEPEPEPKTDPAVFEADEASGTDLEPELVETEVVEDAPEPSHEQEEPKAEQVEAQAREEAEAAKQNAVGATNSEDDMTDLLLNSGSVFNPRQLQKDLAFSEHNLDDAFMSQSGMFAHYSGVAHRAARRYDQISQQVKLVEATLDKEVRQKAADDGEKLTEAAIKNRILLDARHRRITERMLDAKAVAGMTKDACESFKQRRDMLIQMGANVREEQKGEMRMKAARESQQGVQDRALARLNQG